MSYARTITLIGAGPTGSIETRREIWLVDASTGPSGATGILLTLPNIVSDGMSHTFRRIDAGTSGTSVTIQGITGTQTINNLTSINLPALSDTVIQSYEGKWYTVQGLNQSSYGLPLNFRFTQPNGNGFETSQNQWFRAGTFIYRGTSVDGPIGFANVLLYTTNTNTWHRARLYNLTNATQLSVTTQSNGGINTSPEAVNFGPVTNLPTGQAILEIQLLATNNTGDTGISGRQNIGIHSVQLYG